jgi:peptidoglycan hydrolase-like protein with peptidoglycan-binding domain
MTDPDIKTLQIFLNTHGFPVDGTGSGSSGHETSFFGAATLKAVEAFQVHYNIADPDDAGYGLVGPNTRRVLNQMNQ